MPKVVIHTDGGADPNPGPGGWAAVLRHGAGIRELSGGCPATTNNKMELTAAIEALRSLAESSEVELWTDSEYVQKGMTAWLAGWKTRGWRNVAKQPVKNAELWRELDALASGHAVSWRWLKGHAGHPDNERADRLAAAEIKAIYERHGKQELKRMREQLDSAARLL